MLRLFVLPLLIGYCFGQDPVKTSESLQGRGIDVEQKRQVREELSKNVPRGYALIIGVGTYQKLDPRQNLKYSENDARHIHDVLIGQESGSFEPENVRELIGPEATLAKITEALDGWLPSVATKNDRVVIYFAGHGFLADHQGYLAPYDVDPKRLKETAYSMEKLGEVVGKRIHSRWTVLFTDACHSGAITPETTPASINDGLAGINVNVLSLTASRKNESSFEDPELGFGVFTYYLWQGLRGQADRNKDGKVTANELVEYVRTNVYDHVTKRHQEQSPHENQDFDPQLVLAFNPGFVPQGGQTVHEGELVVESNKNGVEIFLDGKPVGVVNQDTPLRLPGISVGSHVVRGVKKGYDDDNQEIPVYPGRPTTVSIKIQFARVRKKAAVDQFNEGLKLYNKGSEKDCRQALPLFASAFAADPKYSEAAMYLGRTYQILYEDKEALQYLKKAVDLDPDFTEARISYASLLLDRGETAEAVRQLRQVLDRDPKNSLAHSHLSHAYFMLESFDKASGEALEAIRLDPSNSQAYLWKGDSLRARKKFDQGKQSYLEFLRISDFDPSLQEKIAYYLLSNPFSNAFALRRATERQIYRDQRNQAYFGLCNCEQVLGELDEAMKHCKKALAYDPQDPYSYFHLGVINLKLYNMQPAKSLLLASQTCLQKMLAINPELSESDAARQYLAVIDDRLKKFSNR